VIMFIFLSVIMYLFSKSSLIKSLMGQCMVCQRLNDGHVRKILHLQREIIQQPNQRQANGQTQSNISK